MRTTFAILLLSAFPAAAQERQLPFDKAWDLQGDRTVVASEAGRQVLQVENGYGHRRDVRLQDGTIDFDVQVTDRRSFIYLHFRVVAGGEREEFYLRPHKSQLPDAVQYAPVWQERSAWQLHHGPGGTAAAAFEPGAWMHVRVVMQGRHAAIFIRDMTTPALLVPRMARDPQPGHIAVGGFLPANVPGSGPIAKFANVSVRPDVSFDFAAVIAAAAPAAASPSGATVVRTWSVSEAFVAEESDMPAQPGSGVARRFTRLDTEPDGLLELDRHVKVPPDNRMTTAMARVTVRAERAGLYAFDLGFSDFATVFVNGTPVFRGNASYSFDRPRREGLIGFDQARLYLPLKAGDNDVSVVVSEVFGGWGIMGRFVGAAGITVAAQ